MIANTLDEKAIFKVACSIESAEARNDYLNQVCGDNQLLCNRVATLLRMHEEEPDFLESPAVGSIPTLDQPITEKPGTQIGRYKLLEEIGEGGMGLVYMAEQREPVRRTVALKIIKPGMDTREVIARFEVERQALAMMDHPNIARILDGGATESGRPYFVMERVQGMPITEYCDQANLTPRQRLSLFVLVCQAVQHAHQKGIIHRDLKPSNVLVTLHDGVPVPKIIDFGIAKAIHQPLTEKTLFTGQGRMIGTPMYMSPEQAEMTGFDLDTRSDIYSLGVLLYELLTGSTPFDRERLRKAGFDEVRRVIHEEESPRPSHRLSTLSAEAISTITAHRSVDARRLGRLLRGDLDWIVMKALQKDRTRRYESASALAADVERHLAHEPIQARPPTLSDRAAKWARRHRPVVWSAVGSAVAVVSVLVASTILLFAGYQRERQERDAAAANATKAEENAARAEKNYERAREAVKQMLTRVADEQVGAIPEMKEVRRRLLEDAAAFYTELLKLNPRDAVAYFERAEVYMMLARYKEGLADFEKATELDPDNAEFHMRLGLFLRQYCADLAYRDVKHALVHAKRAVELDPRNVSYQGELARTYDYLGEPGEAKATLDRATRMAPESAEAYNTIAVHYNLIGDPKASLTCIEKAIALDRSILDRSIWGRRTLADVLIKLGERERALAETNKAYEVMLKLPYLFDHFTWVADAFARLGEDEKALAVISKAIETNPKPNDLGSFWLYLERGDMYTARQMYASALADYDKGIELAPFRSHIYKRRAKAHFYLKNYEKALADIAKAVELLPSNGSNLWCIPPAQVARCPDEHLRKGLLELADKAIEKTKGAAGAYAARGILRHAFGNQEEALADFRKAVELRPEEAVIWYQCALGQLVAGRLDDYRKDCAEMLQRFGQTDKPEDAHWVAWACALAPDATKDWPKAVGLAEKAAKSDPKSITYLNTLGAVLCRAGRWKDALAPLSEADAPVMQPSESIKSSPAYTWFFLAMAHHRLGRTEEAQKWLDKATQSTDKALKDHEAGTGEQMPWNRRVTLKLLRDEAEALLRPADKPPAGKEKAEKGK